MATCLLGIHKWQGCCCVKCGATRDKEHEWNGCRCVRCGLLRNEEHDYQYVSELCVDVCTRCGKQGWGNEGHNYSIDDGLGRKKCCRCGAVDSDGKNGICIDGISLDRYFNWQEYEIMRNIAKAIEDETYQHWKKWLNEQSEEYRSSSSIRYALENKFNSVSIFEFSFLVSFILNYLASLTISVEKEEDKTKRLQLMKTLFYAADIPKKIARLKSDYSGMWHLYSL